MLNAHLTVPTRAKIFVIKNNKQMNSHEYQASQNDIIITGESKSIVFKPARRSVNGSFISFIYNFLLIFTGHISKMAILISLVKGFLHIRECENEIILPRVSLVES